jgi:choline dehydrogenase-like flavoprotein
MATTDTDVVIAGAGGDGPALAWRLGQLGIDVLVLEAGPWNGHEDWPDPYTAPGGTESSDPDALSGELMEEQFNMLENDTNNPVSGKLRFGPAERCRGPWYRSINQNLFLYQVAGVGGTTLHYLGNHPRAYPLAINEQGDWPSDVSYSDFVPYYQHLEEKHPVLPAPKTPKEDLYFQGAEEAGYDLLDVKNVTEDNPGYRPQLNAILQPSEKLKGNYQGDFTYPDVKGSTLSGFEFMGTPTPFGAPVEEKAKRSSNTSLIPRALKTGNVTVRPNAFVTNVLTNGNEATGVEFRDTWSDETEQVDADVVVLSAGVVETPRLFLNSDLPANEWVGKGMTTHYFDWIVGVFEEDVLNERLGQPTLDPHVGQNSAARFDKPGTGGLELVGDAPGLTSFANYSFSSGGYNFINEEQGDIDGPWDTRGRIVGKELKDRMADYKKTLAILVLTDDPPEKENGVTLDPALTDEHGPVARVEWRPSPEATENRTEMAEIATNILRGAGATHVHRADWPPLLLHLQSSMRMGKVTDSGAEALDVGRLFIGDHSVLANSLGSPNPTHTGQAVALRTAETIADRYFPNASSDRIGGPNTRP